MKFLRTRNNTENQLIFLLRQRAATVEQLVSHVYPCSKQPAKKARTFARWLKRLERRGDVVECGGVWMAGKAIGGGQ